MPNFFDQFDAALSPTAAPPPAAPTNFFDRFDAPSVSVGQDIAKSAGTGLENLVLGTAGAGGDTRSLLSAAADKAGALVGASPQATSTVKSWLGAASIAPMLPALINPVTGPAAAMLRWGPSSGEVRDSIEQVTGAQLPSYTPQTPLGRYTQTGVEMLPALFGGEGSAISRLVRNVAIPAVTSETAGHAVAGTAAEPYVRALTAVAAGAAAAPRGGAIAPTADELVADARGPAGYGNQAVADLRIQPASVNQLADSITADLQGAGFRARNVGGTFGAVDELRDVARQGAASGPAPTAADVNSVRRSLRVTQQGAANPMSPNHAEYGAAGRAISMIDDYMASLQAPDVLSGDAQAASSALNSARGDYAAASRAQRLDEAQYRAENNAGAANSGQNVNNAMRQQLKTILNNPAQRRGYSPDEIDQMERIVRGTFTGNAARFVGNLFGGSGLGAIASAGTGFVAGGPAGAFAFPALGQVARQIGNASTARNISALNSMVRMRSPLGAAAAAAAPPSGLSAQQAALLGALAVLRRQQGQQQ